MSVINITLTFTLLAATEGLPRFTSDTSRSTNTDGTPCTTITVSCETWENSLITKRTPIRSISLWNVFNSRTSSGNKVNSKGGETEDDLMWGLSLFRQISPSSKRPMNYHRKYSTYLLLVINQAWGPYWENSARLRSWLDELSTLRSTQKDQGQIHFPEGPQAQLMNKRFVVQLLLTICTNLW